MLMVNHRDLGGDTDGIFHVQVALREELEETPLRLPVGTQEWLNQVINPMIWGEGYTRPEPQEGTPNTYRGLLSWCR
jgi:hypothetical protein